MTTSTEQPAGLDGLLAADSLLRDLVDNLPQHIMLLNPMLQAIYLNASLREFARENGTQITADMRPGELFSCDHSLAAENGCGTALTCKTCGALTSILAALDGEASTNECRIIRKRDNGLTALDFRVWATPVSIGEKQYALVVATDVTTENRLQMLEGVFLHNIKNTALSINYFTTLLQDESIPIEETRSGLITASNRLLGEIGHKQLLYDAEQGNLEADAGKVDLTTLLQQLVSGYSATIPGGAITIDSSHVDSGYCIISDRSLLTLVIEILLESALAAMLAGEVITVACSGSAEVTVECRFSDTISPEERQQIFRRFVSGKGTGRGLGTYCVQLLTERYLHGTISFGSTSDGTTLFRLTLPPDICSAG